MLSRSFHVRVPVAVLALFLLCQAPQSAATFPSGFTETIVATGLTNVTAMDFAPDGRLFVLEQAGTVRVIKGGRALPSPFVSIPVIATGERGLLGIAFDPQFATNQFVYLYYTATNGFNRVARFTASGDVAVSGSEALIFEITDAPAPGNHNGGAIHFGPDGKLYIAVGDYAIGTNSQLMTTVAGKMLRINANGTIPSDNPFFGSTTGNNRAIWALGLRNPFTFGFHRQTGRMFINDVGASSFEEINDGIAGSNYGWPESEGATADPRFRAPLHTYARGGAEGNCAIVGGAFYDAAAQFPAEFAGDYFFSDLCSGIIKRFRPATGAVVTFATGAQQIVDLKVSTGGSLYYLDRWTGSVIRVNYLSSTNERIAIGVGDFAGSAGRIGVRDGAGASYGLVSSVQVPWTAYTDAGGGARVAVGDVDGDGLDEVVVGLSGNAGGAGWIAVLDDAAHGHALVRWLRVPWDRYNTENGDVFPAVGNLDADPAAEIVAGLGNGSNGWYAIFDDASANYAFTAWRQLDWMMYDAANGTTHPAVGDVDGDGANEIVLGTGTGGSGWIAIVNGAASGFAHRRWIQVHWDAYNQSGGGVWPAVGDVDGDGRGEIVAGLEQGGNGWAEVIDDAAMNFAHAQWLRLSWDAYNAAHGETHPAVGNVDDDPAAEILLGHAAFAMEGGWAELFDDAANAYARRGWLNAGWPPARAAGAASYPAIGRMR